MKQPPPDRSSNSQQEKILIIKHGALGDMVQALGPMAAIRDHHDAAHITIMTTAPYQELLRASGYCDQIWIDQKPRWYQPGLWLDLRHKLREARYSRVYDLQTSKRSSTYFHLYWPDRPPHWSGIARGCSAPHANPARDHMHTIDRQAEQLKFCGIVDVSLADISWIDSDTSRFSLTEPFVLMVPGGAPHRPAKRWPSQHFTALATVLINAGITPALLGTRSESHLLEAITTQCPKARNLCGLTDIADLAALARRAVAALGNDTGPMHMIAAAGCPSLVLFSRESNPELCTPRGFRVETLRRKTLEDLSIRAVTTTLMDMAPGLESLGQICEHPPGNSVERTSP
jgi:ADP-heptose:LPS heptosyltransferase